MDIQIEVVLISGVFGVVIGPLMAKLINPSIGLKNTSETGGTKPKGKRVIWQSAIGGFIGVFLGFLFGYMLVLPLVLTPCSFFKPTNVTITSPTSGSKVPELITVQGTACHISNDKELWLFIGSNGVPGYYPQSGPIIVSSDGQWSVSVYIGSDNSSDVGGGFILTPALADKEGSAVIQNYIKHSGNTTNSLDPLPGGIQLMNQELVVRK